MIIWYKAAWVDPMFAAFNALAPGRDHGADGTISNQAHRSEVTGHNPDDTPGVRAERTDADTKPEVRAADVDSDLRTPGVTMQMVVDAILATPRDRNRLIYIIYNRSIWRASAGWRKEPYSGASAHTDHAHFSGHPDADEDGAPWESILNLGGDMTPEQAAALNRVDTRITALFYGADTNTWIEPPMRGERNQLREQLTRIEEAQGGEVTPTPEQWAQLTAAILDKVGTVAEAAAERAVRRVLGAVDGSSPTT